MRLTRFGNRAVRGAVLQGRCPIVLLALPNPNGIPSSSPGLRHQALPWEPIRSVHQPQRGCVHAEGDATPLRLILIPVTQPRVCRFAPNPGLRDDAPSGHTVISSHPWRQQRIPLRKAVEAIDAQWGSGLITGVGIHGWLAGTIELALDCDRSQ